MTVLYSDGSPHEIHNHNHNNVKLRKKVVEQVNINHLNNNAKLEMSRGREKTAKRGAKDLVKRNDEDANDLLSEQENETQDLCCSRSPSGSGSMDSTPLSNNSSKDLRFQQSQFNNTPFRHAKIAIATVLFVYYHLNLFQVKFFAH